MGPFERISLVHRGFRWQENLSGSPSIMLIYLYKFRWASGSGTRSEREFGRRNFGVPKGLMISRFWIPLDLLIPGIIRLFFS